MEQKIMKIFLILLLITFPFSAMSDEVEALKSIDSLFIQTDNRWDVLADPPVSCMNFESFFGRKGGMITEPSIVDGLCKSIMFLKKSKHQKINPRCKIYFFSSDSIIDNNNVWNEFTNGSISNSYSGNTLPGTTDFEDKGISIWEKIIFQLDIKNE